MKIRAGHWELPIEVVGKEGNIATVNINEGAILVFEMMRGWPIRGWYDGLGGKPINDFSQIYIWNSTEKTSTGKIKKVFVLNMKMLADIINKV